MIRCAGALLRSDHALDDIRHIALASAGATLVASTLAETRAYLGGLVEIPRIPLLGAIGGQAA